MESNWIGSDKPSLIYIQYVVPANIYSCTIQGDFDSFMHIYFILLI